MSQQETVSFVVAGVDSRKMAGLVKGFGGDRVKVFEASDMGGAKMVKKGEVDFFLGTCWSGGGGALAAATIQLGASRVFIAGTPGIKPNPEKIREAAKRGVKAFGFAQEQSKTAIEAIVKTILELNESCSL